MIKELWSLFLACDLFKGPNVFEILNITTLNHLFLGQISTFWKIPLKSVDHSYFGQQILMKLKTERQRKTNRHKGRCWQLHNLHGGGNNTFCFKGLCQRNRAYVN